VLRPAAGEPGALQMEAVVEGGGEGEEPFLCACALICSSAVAALTSPSDGMCLNSSFFVLSL